MFVSIKKYRYVIATSLFKTQGNSTKINKKKQKNKKELI